MKIAENIIAESTSEKAQEIAQKMIDRANLLMEKIETRKNKWETNTEDRVNKLRKNLATHQVRRDKAIENIMCCRTIFTGEKGKWLLGHN